MTGVESEAHAAIGHLPETAPRDGRRRPTRPCVSPLCGPESMTAGPGVTRVEKRTSLWAPTEAKLCPGGGRPPAQGVQGWQAGDGSIGAAASITLRIAGTAGNIARVPGPPQSPTRSVSSRPAWPNGTVISARARSRFDALAAWYLDDYTVRRLRTLDTAR